MGARKGKRTRALAIRRAHAMGALEMGNVAEPKEPLQIYTHAHAGRRSAKGCQEEGRAAFQGTSRKAGGGIPRGRRKDLNAKEGEGTKKAGILGMEGWVRRIWEEPAAFACQLC